MLKRKYLKLITILNILILIAVTKSQKIVKSNVKLHNFRKSEEALRNSKYKKRKNTKFTNFP